MEAADAIVIGAGHNGLVAANLLADAGWQVLVLEAADEPGGAVHTKEVTAPGFRNDLCSAFFPMTALSPAITALDLGSHGLRWTHAPLALAHVLPDDRVALLSRDLDRTTASLASFASADVAAWTRMVEQWRALRDPLVAALFGPFPPVRASARLAGRAGVAELIRLARMLMLPARQLVEENFAGDGARLLVAGSSLHTDVGIDSAGSGVFGWLLAMAAQDVGFPVPVGGAGELTGALVRRLRARGGEVRCGQPVSRILIGRGRAVGVRDAAGNPIRARSAVLADVPAPTLYRELIGVEHLPNRLLDDLRRFTWDSGTVKVDWALSGPIPWSNPDAAGAGTVHLGVDLDGMTGYAADLARRRVPEQPFVLLGQMTTADPTRSPAGTESAWAYTHVPHGIPVDTAAVAARLEQVVEKHAPGFRDLVIARYVQGPAELQGHNPGLIGGAINGGSAAIHQQLIFRPIPGLGRADTPVDRLFLAGSSAHPGGAVHGGPGANAARAALRRAGLFGDAYAGIVGGALRAIYA
ncbi:MAG TPA: NAD(P)/FAD-dependent oxidoreductase [Pseudonocardiaceae bacterium]|nr:NAD(P)/FAD-dependent oxidoreductase [Pseudonocardiaceae bacterium]